MNKILADVILKKTGKKKTPFHLLEPFDQRLVLMQLRDDKQFIKVLGLRWYDLLSKTFCVDEYSLENGHSFNDLKEAKRFDSFEEFFKYLDGDIYSYSCFFGYTFTSDEINKFHVNLKKLNFDSFTKETIDDFSLEKILKQKQKETILVELKGQRKMDWVTNCPEFSTYKQLLSLGKKYARDFGLFVPDHFFFSTLLRKRAPRIKNAVIEYFCNEGRSLGLSIDEILLFYGREAAQYAVEHYIGGVAYSTRRKHISLFNQVLNGYDKGPNTLRRSAKFDPESHLYVVKDIYVNDDQFNVGMEYYFCKFEEFADFLSGDLSGAILTFAPIKKELIEKYKTDEKTLLPIASDYDRYRLVKEYKKGEFIVSQKWINTNNIIINQDDHTFDKIFDFIHFLKKDLSNADLLMCDEVANLKSISDTLNLCGVKVRSGAAKELGILEAKMPKNRLAVISFEQTTKYELSTFYELEKEHTEDENYDRPISYVSDIHLLHKMDAFKCESLEDSNYVVKCIASDISEQSTEICLIGGDTSSDFETFGTFVSNLARLSERQKHYIFILGNHELWPFPGLLIDDIVKSYRELLTKYKMRLLQNNILYISERTFKEISEEELLTITENELRERVRKACFIMFGGIGFAGKNELFNANQGIYRDTITREQEIKESQKFLCLYNKVKTALKGRDVIIFTHTPFKDRAGDMETEDGFIYVSGHNHRNFYYDDGRKRIYADNQIGYKGKKVFLKKLFVNFGYDWFLDYEDGIHEISKDDYETFYRGVNEPVTFNREFEKLYMIKREKTYMFFMQTQSGRLSILNGGAIRKAGNHSLEFYYDNILRYSESVRCFLSNYSDFQKKVSSEVKSIGGDGRIHGCIIDINFLNHLYLNPLDGSITPYFALSMVDKYVYSNFQSLLKYKCPELYKKYEELACKESQNNSLILYEPQNKISDLTVAVYDTEMYRISRILNGLQYTTKYNIVRIWSDTMIQDVSEESGRLIVSSIINPDTELPKELKEAEIKRIKETYRPRFAKFVIKRRVEEEKKKRKNREREYNALIEKETNGAIKVLSYNGAKEKAQYKCNVCNHEWLMRPDHFRDRRNYTCPNCSKKQ